MRSSFALPGSVQLVSATPIEPTASAAAAEMEVGLGIHGEPGRVT